MIEDCFKFLPIDTTAFMKKHNESTFIDNKLSNKTVHT